MERLERLEPVDSLNRRFLNQPAQVYEFASNPENLPKWAAGLGDSINKVNED